MGGRVMIGRAEIEARVSRLAELARGLTKEVPLWGDGCDPLQPLERRVYLEGIQEAVKGVDDARVLLVKALRRMGGGPAW